MSNELTTRNSTTVSTTAASGNPFLQASTELGGDNEGLTFASFSGKVGKYSYGAEKKELEDGWKGAINMATASRGWIAWVDGEVKGEKMVKILEGSPPIEAQLPDLGPLDDDEDGWSEQFSFEVCEMESGEHLFFKNSSKSGLRAFGNLLSNYGKAIQKGLNIGDSGEELHPIVEFTSQEFTPKGAKKKEKAYAPSFKIVDWISDSALLEMFGGEDDAANYENEEEETPVKESSKSVKEEVKEPEEKSAPATGRRRRQF